MTTQEIDYSRKWYVMTAVGLGIFLATIDGSIVNIALPTLAESFDAPFPVLQWVVLAYLLTVTTLMLGVGRLADIRGKKPIYATGFVVFTVGSVLCGLSQSVYALIFFRVVQAIGAAMTMALGTAIVTESFPPNERGRAIGIAGTIISVGIAIGPTLGGFILEHFSWHWIFFVNLPVGIAGTWMVLRYVPALKPHGGQHFDLTGALTLLFALLAFLLAFTFAQQSGFADKLVIGLFLAWLVLQSIFVYIELRQPQPLIDLHFFSNLLFTINLLAAVAAFVCFAGTQILAPFYLENILGYSPQQAGFLLMTVPVALGIVSPISGALSDRFGTRLIAAIGIFILAIGFWSLSSLSEDTTALGYIWRYFLVGVGFGAFQSPNNSAIMGFAPRDKLGVVSSMLAISRTLGQVTGIAVMGTLWASRVFYYSGETIEAGATAAPVSAQVAGLQDVFVVASILMAIVFVVYVLTLRIEKRTS